MSKSPPTPPNDAREPDADAARVPALRLRYDTSEQPSHHSLQNVISQVESIADGIDSLIDRTRSSSVNPAQSMSADDLDETTAEDDEPMMAMFDEEQPADIHAIDRMLAAKADQELEEDRETIADALINDDADFPIEGDFEDISGLLKAPAIHANEEPETIADPRLNALSIASHDATSFDASGTPRADCAQGSEPSASHVNHALAEAEPLPIEDLAAAAAPAEPSRPIAANLSLEETQARGILDALSGAALAAHPAPTVAAFASPAAGSPVTAMASATAVSAADQFAASVHSTVAPSDGPRYGGSLNRLVSVVAWTNLPLRHLPQSLLPMVNVLAITLALWAVFVMTLGPRLASAQSNTSPPSKAGESTATADHESKANTHDASSDGQAPASH